MYPGSNAFLKRTDIFRAPLTNSIVPTCGLASKRSSPAARLILKSTLSSVGHEVDFFWVSLRAHISPWPRSREIITPGQRPDLDLLPSVLGEETAIGG